MDYVNVILAFDFLKIPAILGLCLLTGYTGLFSFGHAGFIAIGAYVSVIVTKFMGLAALPFSLGLFVGMAAGIAVAALVALLLGSITLNLKGDYFCLVTLGFGEVVRVVIENMSVIGDSRGIQNIRLLAAPFNNPYVIMLPVCIALVALLAALVNSRHGRNMIAIREEELAAQMVGIDVFKYKMVSFVISAAFASISGALWAHYMGMIKPKMFMMDVSTEITIIVILGGIGSISGSVIAALVMLSLPQVFLDFAAWRLVVYGALVVAIMIWRPKGLMGGFELTPGGVKKWLTARRLAALDRLEQSGAPSNAQARGL